MGEGPGDVRLRRRESALWFSRGPQLLLSGGRTGTTVRNHPFREGNRQGLAPDGAAVGPPHAPTKTRPPGPTPAPFVRMLRSFLFAPAHAVHRRELRQMGSFLPKLSASEVMEGAYRRSASRQNAFVFAQGAVVGAMGNLFASALGHFIDRAGALNWRDGLWALLLVGSAGLIISMTWGAVRRYRQNSEVEALFVQELVRRGGMATDDKGDPDELLEMGPPG